MSNSSFINLEKYLESNNDSYLISGGGSSSSYYLLNRTFFELPSTPHVYEYTLWQKIIFSMFMIPIIIFSIIGNILVIVAISKYQYLRITNNIFLASLAVADLAVAISAMTLNALQILSGHWYLKSFMCRFWFCCDVLFSTASILHLFCVSLDRYLSISDEYSFYYITEHPTKSWRVRIMISSVWITSLLLSSVPIFTDLFTTAEHSAIIDSLDFQNGQCAFVVNLPYRFISSWVSFWIPAAGMITFYTLVMKKAHNMEKNKLTMYKAVYVNNNNNNNNNATNNKNDDSNNQYSSLQHSQNLSTRNSSARSSAEVVWKRKYKALKTLGTVITVFCVCWVLFFLRYTLCGTTHSICPDSINKSLVLEDILFWIGYFNSMVNPFLYNFTNQDFRKAFRDLLHLKKKKKNRSSQLHESRKMSTTVSEYSGTRKFTLEETRFIKQNL